MVRPGGVGGNLKRAGSGAVADDREFGLGQQCEKIGPGCLEPEFDHAVGHRNNVVHGAKRILERIGARSRKRALEDSRDLLGGKLASARPTRRRDPEDVGKAIVADVPTFGEAADNVASRIKTDQPLTDVGEQNGVGAWQWPKGRITDLGRSTNDNDFGPTGVAVAARAGRNRQNGEERERQSAPEKGGQHAGVFSRKPRFSKRWIILASCFTGVRQLGETAEDERAW